MSRFHVAGRTTNAPTATLPGASIYSGASQGLRIMEIGVCNTTSTACAVAIRRLSTAGTQGAALDEVIGELGIQTAAPAGTGVNSHTVGPTITAGEVRRCTLGAAVGSAFVWTFGANGLEVGPGTGNGIGLLCPTGTGQVLDFWIEWEE